MSAPETYELDGTTYELYALRNLDASRALGLALAIFGGELLSAIGSVGPEAIKAYRTAKASGADHDQAASRAAASAGAGGVDIAGLLQAFGDERLDKLVQMLLARVAISGAPLTGDALARFDGDPWTPMVLAFQSARRNRLFSPPGWLVDAIRAKRQA